MCALRTVCSPNRLNEVLMTVAALLYWQGDMGFYVDLCPRTNAAVVQVEKGNAAVVQVEKGNAAVVQVEKGNAAVVQVEKGYL